MVVYNLIHNSTNYWAPGTHINRDVLFMQKEHDILCELGFLVFSRRFDSVSELT